MQANTADPLQVFCKNYWLIWQGLTFFSKKHPNVVTRGRSHRQAKGVVTCQCANINEYECQTTEWVYRKDTGIYCCEKLIFFLDKISDSWSFTQSSAPNYFPLTIAKFSHSICVGSFQVLWTPPTVQLHVGQVGFSSQQASGSNTSFMYF